MTYGDPIDRDLPLPELRPCHHCGGAGKRPAGSFLQRYAHCSRCSGLGTVQRPVPIVPLLREFQVCVADMRARARVVMLDEKEMLKMARAWGCVRAAYARRAVERAARGDSAGQLSDLEQADKARRKSEEWQEQAIYQ